MEAKETCDICQQFDVTDVGSQHLGTRLHIRVVRFRLP
jgi:hypothetical protein